MKPNPKTHYRIDTGQESRLEFWIPKQSACEKNRNDPSPESEAERIQVACQDTILLNLHLYSKCSEGAYEGEYTEDDPIWIATLPAGRQVPVSERHRMQSRLDGIFSRTNSRVLGKMISRAIAAEDRILEIFQIPEDA